MANKEESYKKCTLEVIPCSWIKFKGDSTGKKFPQPPEDAGLSNEFLKWCIENNIHPASTPGTSGPGIHMHAYFPKDIEKITKWFKEKGVKITKVTKS